MRVLRLAQRVRPESMPLLVNYVYRAPQDSISLQLVRRVVQAVP